MKYANYKVIKGMVNGPNFSDIYIDHHSTSRGGFMKEQQDIELRLWDYIDGFSSPEEKSEIGKLIAENREWQVTYQSLLETQSLLKASELEMPSMRFSKDVMEQIAKFQVAPATKSYINKNIVRGIAGFFILMTVGFVVYSFAQVNWADSTGTPALLANYQAPNINWSRFFNNAYSNVFILINVILGLVLLDMYLSRKKNELYKSKT